MSQVREDTATGCGERVTKRNGTTVRVGDGRVETELLGDGKVLGSERLIHLDQVHVLEREAGLLECALDGGYRSNAHYGRVDAYWLAMNMRKDIGNL